MSGSDVPSQVVKQSDVAPRQEQIRAAGRDLTLHTYPGTSHWFAEPNRSDVYNPEAAELLWERTLAFLREKLG